MRLSSRTVTDQWRRVGVFSTLTNAYAIVAVGASENFYRYVQLCAQALIAPHVSSARRKLTRYTQCL